MIGKNTQLFILSKYLLAFIFCGVILGETISLSMVVTTFGSEIIGKLYLINALLLVTLPIIFFRHIDIINRGKLLVDCIVKIVIVLVLLFGILTIFDDECSMVRIITALMYPVSYVSKTLLFLLFWTYLNDIYTIKEAKKYYPVIAAWGFGGAVTGVVIARLLLSVVSTKGIMAFWIVVYIVAWFLSGKINNTTSSNRYVINKTENGGIAYGINVLLKNKLVVIIAIIYFGIILSVFLMDFVFWKQCNIWFKTVDSVASFQFTFYILHATATILLLRYVLPIMIEKMGVTKVMYGLPLLFVFGGILLMVIDKQTGVTSKILFFAGIQFVRNIVFEMTFAISYQIYFTAIVKDQRGRTKTFIEGIIKPAAIFSSGSIVVILKGSNGYIAPIIIVVGGGLLFVIYYLRLLYVASVINKSKAHMEITEIIDLVGRPENTEFYMIVKKIEKNESEDMKLLAIQLYEKAASAVAYENMLSLYENEKSPRVREAIARSLSLFYGYKTRYFIEKLLHEENQRIKANALFSLNKMQCNWKKYLKPIVVPHLFESDLRVQVESACYIWQNGTSNEKSIILQFLKKHLEAREPEKQVAGIYLAVQIQNEGWETIVVEKLASDSLQVYKKSIEAIVENGRGATVIRALEAVGRMDRNRMTIAGEVIRKNPVGIKDELACYFNHELNTRFSFEIVNCLRKAADEIRATGEKYVIDKKISDQIRLWILNLIESIYLDVYNFHYVLKEEKNIHNEPLQDSLRERQSWLCRWGVTAMVVMDTKGIFVWPAGAIDFNEEESRNNLIEVFESLSNDKVSALLLPLLKMDSWDVLIKIATTNYHFNNNDNYRGINYFLRSKNRYIIMSSLFSIRRYYSDRNYSAVITESLIMLQRNSSDENIAAAANNLLNKNTIHCFDKQSRAFEIVERVLFFKKVQLFHTVSAEKLLKIVELARSTHYQKGDTITTAGNIGDQVYIVKTGKIMVETSINGRRAKPYIVGSGQLFGAAGLFSKIPQNLMATVEEPSIIYSLRKTDVKKIIKEIPDVAFTLIETIGESLFYGGDEVLEKPNK